MPASLVESQFAVLEVPGDDEHALSIRADRPIKEIVEAARRFIEAGQSQPAQ